MTPETARSHTIAVMGHGVDDDASLVKASQRGDTDAFAEIVRRHERRLQLVVNRILDDAGDAEEAVQDAFVLAWRGLGRYRGEAAVFTWLYRIGVNEALARKRKKRLITTEISATEAETAPEVRRDVQPEASAESAEVRAQVIAALRRLPLEQREAVALRDIAGLSNEEVADALALSVPAAKSRIHRGRLALREQLEEFAADS